MKLGVLIYIQQFDGRVLMIHRGKKDEHLGLWLAPGGKIEKNEAPIEAAIRGAKEETGLDINAPQLKGILTFPDDGTSPFGDEWTVFVFYTRIFSGELLRQCPEGDLSWIPQDQLLALPMWEGDRIFTPKIFEQECFLAKLWYHNENLVNTVFWGKKDS